MLKFLFFTVYFSMSQLDCCVSKALFLTPLIEKGEIQAAQRKAEVRPFLPKVKSYSGYLTVDKVYNSNIFFWFFPKTSNWTDAPLMLSLYGGPATSSLFPIFWENGPYIFKKNKLQIRPHSWTNFYNMLYVDAPVGTGFSFSDSYRGYGGNHTVVGGHVLEVLRQFLLLFPKIQKNKVILSGQSYGTKHVTSLAYSVLTKPTKPKINIWRLFIGSPWISLEDLLPHYNSYLEAHGVLDRHGSNIMRQQTELALSFVKAREWEKARDTCMNIFSNNSLVYKLTGLKNILSLLRDRQPSRVNPYFVEFINKNSTKAALHVRNVKFVANNMSIAYNLKDAMAPIKKEFGFVIEKFRTLVYVGQFDINTPYLLHTRVMENTDWSGNWGYTQARRHHFRWKQHLCGYYKTVKGYTEVMVRNAGHLVLEDQPHCSLGLLLNFMNGTLDE